MENRITSTSLTVSEFTAENITSIFLYGTLNVPENLYNRIKTRDYIEILQAVIVNVW